MKYLLASVAITLGLYLVAAFGQWELNPGNWPGPIRGMVSVMWGFSIIYTGILLMVSSEGDS